MRASSHSVPCDHTRALSGWCSVWRKVAIGAGRAAAICSVRPGKLTGPLVNRVSRWQILNYGRGWCCRELSRHCQLRPRLEEPDKSFPHQEKIGCMRVSLMAELSSPISNIVAGFRPARIFVWPEFLPMRASPDSRKLDKQSVLPKKELRLLTNQRLLPPSSPYSLASSTNKTEAGTRRRIFGHEDVRLIDVEKRNRSRNKEALTPLRSPCVRLAPWRYLRP